MLKVVLTLTECPVSCNQSLNDEQSIVLDLCTSCLILEHHAATSKALDILTKLVVLNKLDSIASSGAISKDQVAIVETLSAVYFQSMLGNFLPVNVLHTFERVLKATNLWTQYRIVRLASR